MIELLRRYEPLVNEKNEVIGFKHRATDFVEGTQTSEMLRVMAGAVRDIQSFIQNFDKMKTNQSDLYADAMMAHQEMMKIGLKVDSLHRGFEAVIGRHKQALDVLEFVAEREHESGNVVATLDMVKNAAQKFINPVKLRIAEMEKEHEQSESESVNGNPSVAPEVIPPAEPDPGADASEGEPRS